MLIEAALKRMIFNGFIFEKAIGSRKCLRAENVELQKDINGATEYATFAKVMKVRDTNPRQIRFSLCGCFIYFRTYN